MSPPSVARTHSYPCSRCAVQQAFCPLPEALRVFFEGLKTSAAYAKNDVIFRESEPCHSVFVLCTGRLKLVTGSREGKVLLLRFAAPGEVLGIAEAVLADVPYEYTAVAAEPSIAAAIPRATFMRFVGSHPQARVRLVVALSEQYRTAQRETRLLSAESSTARLARILLAWCDEQAQTAPRGTTPLYVTHTELSQAIGSRRETVTRLLAELDHRGIIERSAKGIVIRGRDELARLATSGGPE